MKPLFPKTGSMLPSSTMLSIFNAVMVPLFTGAIALGLLISFVLALGWGLVTLPTRLLGRRKAT